MAIHIPQKLGISGERTIFTRFIVRKLGPSETGPRNHPQMSGCRQPYTVLLVSNGDASSMSHSFSCSHPFFQSFPVPRPCTK